MVKKENTHSLYDLYCKLQSVLHQSPPKAKEILTKQVKELGKFLETRMEDICVCSFFPDSASLPHAQKRQTPLDPKEKS